MTDREKVALCPWCGSEPVVRPNVRTQIRYAMCEKKGCPLCQQHTIFTLEEWNDRTAALRPEAQGVKPAVKPLEWSRGVVDWARPLPGMKYVACSTTPEGSWAWWLDGGDERGVETSEAEAKAAAQADYEARIFSALDRPEAQDGVASAARMLLNLRNESEHEEFWATLDRLSRAED